MPNRLVMILDLLLDSDVNSQITMAYVRSRPKMVGPQLGEDALSLVDPDGPVTDQPVDDERQLLGRRTGGHGNGASVQGHVAPLDALGGQRSAGGDILGQAHGDDNLGQLPRRGDPQQLDGGLSGRMHFRRASDDSHGHG
jgi:hypothetical protein